MKSLGERTHWRRMPTQIHTYIHSDREVAADAHTFTAHIYITKIQQKKLEKFI